MPFFYMIMWIYKENVMLPKLPHPKNCYPQSISWNSCSMEYSLENDGSEKLILVLYFTTLYFDNVISNTANIQCCAQ